MQIDVFTLVPHAFGWLTEQRPVAAVLDESLELRLFNYRDSTPMRAGQVDDEPYGGGAAMVLDVVAAGLYTRPAEFRGWKVPDVLLAGDHARIDEWRRAQSRLRSPA